jgi:4-hydroxy-3-polyprenylbenzoate decarboxylase
MPSSPLRAFISRLENAGELVRVAATVDPVLEIAAITDRVCKQSAGGPALLFEHPGGSPFALATNLFGSSRRVCQALDIENSNDLTSRLQALLNSLPECEPSSLARNLAGLPDFSRYAPTARAEPDTELVTMAPANLTAFPFLQSWPGDGSADGHGRYITLPQVFTTDPDGGTPNCGLYRVQLRGERELAIQWKKGSGAAGHAELFRRAGKSMPVAIVLGGDPTILFSTMAPLPGELDEMTFAGFLRDTPFVTVPCRTVPLQVPRGAEVVIEGFVAPGDTVTEGPFGNHTGCYAPAAPAPLLRVTAIRHRPDAVIPATVVGPPPMEDCWMAQAWERLLLGFLRYMLPSIADIHFPFEWVFHQSAVISLENPLPGMVRNISARLWALPWFTAARVLVFVAAGGPDTGRNGLSRAAWKCMNVTDFFHDIIRDPATGRIAVDATGCRLSRSEIAAPAEISERVARRWKEYGLA